MTMIFEDNTTVEILDTELENVYCMRWGSQPSVVNVNHAFDVLKLHLHNATSAVTIIVDIRSDPNFPLQVTGRRALAITRHPDFEQWMVVGSNRSAQMISNVLKSVVNAKISWFESCEDALAHLAGNS